MGIVDFSKAKLLDRKWWMRLNWQLDELEAQECRKLIEVKFEQHAAALDYQAGKTFDHHWKHLNELSKKWSVLAFPWLSKQVDGMSSKELLDRWAAAHSNLSPEELEKRSQLTAESLKVGRGPDTQPTSCWSK